VIGPVAVGIMVAEFRAPLKTPYITALSYLGGGGLIVPLLCRETPVSGMAVRLIAVVPVWDSVLSKPVLCINTFCIPPKVNIFLLMAL